MQLIQFVLPEIGRRVGLVQSEVVIDLTSVHSDLTTVYDLVQQSFACQKSLVDVVNQLAVQVSAPNHSYALLLSAPVDGGQPYLLPPFDHPEPSRVLISGTGLTHLGSVKSRDQMHGGSQTEQPQTDSARMFAMGLNGGRPAAGERGVSPEWFYKGNGSNLRGPQANLEIPAFAGDGGEEPEIIGCYVIDPTGKPRRVGFALGNEWSDHATEKVNYLYLAPSKLRLCSMGPSLQVTSDFADIALQCTVSRKGQQIYDSGELRSGEQNMCHSLANIEDHHFKYAQHRIPGDVHLHFFGTSKLSYGTRTWTYQAGDVIRITAPGWCEPLVNSVSAGPAHEARTVSVEPV